MSYVPLSRRESNEGPRGPFEGLPDHLVDPVLRWLDTVFPEIGGTKIRNGNSLRLILSRMQYVVQPGAADYQIMMSLRSDFINNRSVALDVIDALLYPELVTAQQRELLELELSIGGSVWRVADHGLERRVDETAQAAAAAAIANGDAASDELRTAWSAAFGMNPDASDAWDHAIKAVEEALKPVLVPNNPGATLGGVIGPLRGTPAAFEMALRDNGLNNQVGAVETFEDMLHFIWPNPDRHGGADKRTPSIDEARAVVQLAVVVVEWARAGMIKIK